MTPAQFRAKITAGSAEWLGDERHAMSGFIQQETEEFVYSVRNEMEWLNEHMTEVFNDNQFDVVEAFKTPGRLRGKTPRTMCRPQTLEHRAPLNDMFAPNMQPTQSPLHFSKHPKQTTQFIVAEDENDYHIDAHPLARISTGLGKENTDSGYHEMTDGDDFEIDLDTVGTKVLLGRPPSDCPDEPRRAIERRLSELLSPHRKHATTTINHDITQRESRNETISTPKTELRKNTGIGEQGPGSEIPSLEATLPSCQTARTSHQYSISDEVAAAFGAALEEVEAMSPSRPSPKIQNDSSPFDTSTLARPMVRKKSSLTFASLPAREPLTNKKISEPVNAHLNQVEQPKLNNAMNNGYFGSFKGSNFPSEFRRESTMHARDDREEGLLMAPEDVDDITLPREVKAQQELKAQSKASTQRLQERLAMLGKSNPPRLSRSIPTTATVSQTTVQEVIATIDPSPHRTLISTDDADDWIGPMPGSQLPDPVPLMATEIRDTIQQTEAVPNHKTFNVTRDTITMYQQTDSEVKHLRMSGSENLLEEPSSQSIANPSYPQLNSQVSTTPKASHVHRKNIDGPLSASKAKLYSVLRSAKSMFASTAQITAQRRPEIKTPRASPTRLDSIPTLREGTATQGSTSQQTTIINEPCNRILPLRRDVLNGNSSCGTRRTSQRLETIKQVKASSATEKEQLGQGTVRAIEEQHREVMQQSAASIAAPKLDGPLDIHIGSSNNELALSNLPPAPPPKSQLPTSQVQKPIEGRRPLRPTKDILKARPAPVSIKLASQRIGQIAPSNASLGLALHESLAQPVTRPALSKKPSTSSFHTSSSSQSIKTTVSSNSARLKALEVAARKKEQDERDAQKKLDQKRDLERKRAARIDEDRLRAEEQKTGEQQRSLDVKNALQRQTVEQRRLEANRKNEQAMKEVADIRNCSVDESVDTLQLEQPQVQLTCTNDDIISTNKSTTQHMNVQVHSLSSVPYINPAKPAKRHMEHDEEAADNSPEQQQERSEHSDAVANKRRRTSENVAMEGPPRLPMAPPMRPSNMHKKLSNKFAPGFLNNATTTHGAPSMLKQATTTQHHLQHPKTPHMHDLAKLSNAKIAFAEQSQSAVPSQALIYTQQQLQQRTIPATKTPGTAAKSSPHYPNGDSIELPEIATDSEDSGDEPDFVPPEWTNSPELREHLRQQQSIDPLQIFGPIAPLMMEDVFKGNKERQARYRARTSSANWNGPDRLTEEERRKDREARQRLEREGAWTYGSSV